MISTIVGILTFVTSAICLAMYVVWGRFHRVAAVRREVVCPSLLKHAGDFSTAIDHASEVVGPDGLTGIEVSFYFRCLKFLLAFLGIVIITLLSTMASLFGMIFNSLLIWRGFSIDLSFSVQVKKMFDNFREVFGKISLLFTILLYPAEVVFTFFAGCSLDLNVVEVTCSGTQAPAKLFINLVVLGSTVIIIYSEYLELQFTVLEKAFKSIVHLYMRRPFREHVKKSPQNWSSFRYFSELSLASLILFTVSVESTRYIMQLLISLVQIRSFVFTSTGYHASSSQCDEAFYSIDTVLAILSTVLLWLVFFPAVYLVAGALTPKLLDIGLSIEPIVQSEIDDHEAKNKAHIMFKGLKLLSFLAPDLYVFELAKLYI